MGEGLTKATARNIFYGGSLFFMLVFVLLVAQSHWHAETTAISGAPVTEAVAHGKRVWEKHACINCHTIFGEGAYFAPELGNVYERRGPEFIKAWMKAQPTGAPGRRQMPQFHLTDEELDQLVAFLKYTNGINAAKWPPNIEG